jgi:streptogramin lyase
VDQSLGTISTNCSSLFSYTVSTSGTPTDTIQAAINMAHSPTLSLTALTSLVNAVGAPYQPALSSPPTSWTLAINYVGGGLSSPKAIATDTSGNVWVANTGNNSVTELNDVGSAVSGSNGFTAGGISAPTAIAVDTSGAPWVANSGNNTITHLASTGTTGTAYGNGGLSSPSGIAIDSNGDIWVSNAGNSSLSEFTSTGGVLSPATGYTGGGLTLPTAIAVE